MGERPSASLNAKHVPPLPKPAKGISISALQRKGGRFTPGAAAKLPVNP